MTRTKSTLLLLAACIALPCTAPAQSQAPAPRTVVPGPHAVTVESYSALATHTAYHPTDLGSWGAAKRLPIVSWGNGACARNGMAFAAFLTQIASPGYLAIAVGPKVVPPGPAPEPTIDDHLLLDAVDWAIRQKRRFHQPLLQQARYDEDRGDGAVVRRIAGAGGVA